MKTITPKDRDYLEAVRCISLTNQQLYQELDGFLRPFSKDTQLTNILNVLIFTFYKHKNIPLPVEIEKNRRLYVFLFFLMKSLCRQKGFDQFWHRNKEQDNPETVLATARYLRDNLSNARQNGVPSIRLAVAVLRIRALSRCP